ncbi:MAG: MFS transporter, partial [Bacteroidota bacterium]|nr:MFS transporter [Bacteroidota bacterium]
SVLGTISLTSSPQTKSIGYAIYYWLVNIGGALGPFIALFVRANIGMYAVYFVSSLSCTLMFLASLFIFKEPENNEISESIGFSQIIKNMLVVVTNLKFMIFLLIFSLFWLMFWQIYVIIPLYITDYIDANAPIEVIISAGAWGIIALQLVVNYFTKKLSPINAIILGFGIAGLSWLIILSHSIFPFISPITLIVIAVVVFSIGEMTQAPRYYEYIADLAPAGQTAMYQGFAFLPIAIGWFFGGNLGGWLYEKYGRQSHSPEVIFAVLLVVGIASVLLMILYNYIAKPKNK